MSSIIHVKDLRDIATDRGEYLTIGEAKAIVDGGWRIGDHFPDRLTIKAVKTLYKRLQTSYDTSSHRLELLVKLLNAPARSPDARVMQEQIKEVLGF